MLARDIGDCRDNLKTRAAFSQGIREATSQTRNGEYKVMKKGQIAEGIVKSVEFPNKGMVYTDEGDRVIVKNTIPGQRVSFAVNKVRTGKAERRLFFM